MSTSRRRRRPGCWSGDTGDLPCSRLGAERSLAVAAPVAGPTEQAPSRPAQPRPPVVGDGLGGLDQGAPATAGPGGGPVGGPAVVARPQGGAPGGLALVRRAGLRAASVASWGLAAIGTGAGVGVAVGAIAGYEPVVVRSGSMAPGIPVGALVVTRPGPASGVRAGEVVTVAAPTGGLLTHRVVSVRPLGGGAGAVELTLRGDANKADDPSPVIATSVGRPVAVVPVAGRVVAGAGSGFGAVGVGAGLALTIAVGWARSRSDRGAPAGLRASVA